MKKQSLNLILVSFLVVFFSFSISSYQIIQKENSTDITNTPGGKNDEVGKKENWSSWQRTKCYRGLYFRTKSIEFNKYVGKYSWVLEFKNQYTEKINFNCSVFEPGVRDSPISILRITVNGNGGINSTQCLLESSIEGSLKIDKLVFGQDDWSAEPYDCDTN